MSRSQYDAESESQRNTSHSVHYCIEEASWLLRTILSLIGLHLVTTDCKQEFNCSIMHIP